MTFNTLKFALKLYPLALSRNKDVTLSVQFITGLKITILIISRFKIQQ